MSRFIINVPEEERNDIIRLCFQIELAHWFYLDFYTRGLRDKKTCGIKEFAFQIFRHIPYLQPYACNVAGIIDQWKGYKFSVPTFGAILLDENMTHVLLVQSYCSKSSWGFPKGKINKDELPCQCAIREVYEETGFSIARLIDPKEFIEAQINDQLVRLYVVPGVSRTIVFAPKTRNEIKAINWFPVTDLPATRKDAAVKWKSTLGAASFFMVSPFVRRLRQWIFEHDKKIVRRYRRPRFKSCGDLETYIYKESSSYTSYCKVTQSMEALSLAMKSKQSFHVREKKISSELSFNDSSNKTINHDENSSFVEVPASSTVISPETLTPLTVNKIPEVPNKPLPFQPIKLSDSFLKHGISAFVNFKFNIDAFLL
ncbi:decapping mRNA 2 isoform X2 [Rhodnius prolixus]|uniref:decapping mRNA 2 isoform X2 n=1 Tax=Rhodnius prolixus TaxID=13249 RepID=UPI003D1877A3